MNYNHWFEHTFLPFFRSHQLYRDMGEVVEDSPWHREANVAVHTDMVVSKFLEYTDFEWSKDHLKGALSCAFHDVGKPAAMQVHFREDRGEYRKFTGHEQVSTRLFEDFVVANWDLFRDVLVPSDIYDIGWIIQTHLPYGRKREKMQILVNTVHRVLPDNPEVFTTVLRADQQGRISDNMQEKTENLTKWIENEYSTIEPSLTNIDDDAPTLWFLVGASGSGKSTWTKQHTHLNAHVYSWDKLRFQYYYCEPTDKDLTPCEQYSQVFTRSCDDPEFNNKVRSDFNALISKRHNIVVDNTNLSIKRRRSLADSAVSKGYQVVVVLFPTCLDQLRKRLNRRNDRDMPFSVVSGQFSSLAYPSYDKYCHNVVVWSANLNEISRSVD